MRIRCVDKDGRSFFADITEAHYPSRCVIHRLAEWKPGDLIAALKDDTEPVEVLTETYKREYVLHAYGPVACPYVDPLGVVWEVVYRTPDGDEACVRAPDEAP